MDDRKKNAEQKIIRMKENALKDIKNISIKISIEAVKHLIKNSNNLSIPLKVLQLLYKHFSLYIQLLISYKYILYHLLQIVPLILYK